MKKLRFMYPADGDMLTDAAGEVKGDALYIDAAAEAQQPACICGKEAVLLEDGLWHAWIALNGRENTLTVRAGDEETAINVYRLPDAAGKYSLSVDDNIWFLAELNRKPYRSVFDHPYLALYKRAHDEYGAKVRLNLFYEVDGDAVNKYGPFNLSMMTDRYRDEFSANAHWLHMAFHARSEWPANPYENGTYDQLFADCLAVHREIVRFAGDLVLEPATTVHFCRCTPEGIRALHALGVRGLMGLTMTPDGKPSLRYNLTDEQALAAQRYGFWRDPADGMVYGKINVILNQHSPQRIVELLEQEHSAHPLRGFGEIMIHEQYFYEDYPHYEPDFAERVLAACRWYCERGYTGAFFSEAIR